MGVISVDKFIKELLFMLKKERAISDLIVKPISDEYSSGWELISPDGSLLRIRKVSMSLSETELATGITYPGGVQVAIYFPEDEEVYHTFNIPLPYVPFIIKILQKYTNELIEEFNEAGVDLTNTNLAAEARVRVLQNLEAAREASSYTYEDEREVI